MTHRERVLCALNHEEPDRCPMQISFTPEFAVRLRKELGMTESSGHNPHGGGNTYELERALDEDMLITSVGWANAYYSADTGTYTDEWGVGWRNIPYETPYGTGNYTEMTRYPLESDDAIDSYSPPDPTRSELYDDAAHLIKTYGDEYWIIGLVAGTTFETAWALRGLSKLLMDFLTDPDLAAEILDIPLEYHLVAAKRLVEMGVDMIWTGDDVGTQHGMMISPEIWRILFKPRMARFFSELKAIKSRH